MIHYLAQVCFIPAASLFFLSAAIESSWTATGTLSRTPLRRHPHHGLPSLGLLRIALVNAGYRCRHR